MKKISENPCEYGLSKRTETFLFEVGDEVISSSRYHGREILKVVRVTKTQAVLSNKSKVRRELKSYDGKPPSIREVGGYSYGSPTYDFPKPGDVEAIKAEKRARKVKNWFKNKFQPTPEQIEEIYQRYGQPAEGAKDQE